MPAGALTGTGVLSGYLFAFHDLDRSVPDSRMVALTTLIITGLYLVMALEATGSTMRSRIVAEGCALMGLLYVLAIAIPFTRSFFALRIPSWSMLITAVLAAVFFVRRPLGLRLHPPFGAVRAGADPPGQAAHGQDLALAAAARGRNHSHRVMPHHMHDQHHFQMRDDPESGGMRSAARCPCCGWVIAPPATVLLPRHCPRCLGRRRVAVELELMPGMGNVIEAVSSPAKPGPRNPRRGAHR